MSSGSCKLKLLVMLTLLLTGPGRAGAAPVAGGPPLHDDLELAGLVEAAETSLRIMGGRDDGLIFELCGQQVPLARLRQALAGFTEAARRAAGAEELAGFVAQNFLLCRSTGADRPGMAFLTGYYEPEVAGSLVRDETYRYPLYSPPDDLVRRDGREGRLVDGELRPYWSRAEIENGNLLAGYELIYLADPLDAFVLHVQGSGRVRLPDGTLQPVLYAARSGRDYRSIGRLLVDEGRLTMAEADLPGIFAYLRRHPDELRRVLHHNQSYIFFRRGRPDSPGPLGSFGLPLTAGRSLALDQRHYPPGVPAYLAATRPITDEQGSITGWQPFGRFVFNQDSGSAIRGPGRADLFWGRGRYAEIAAGVTRHPAELFILVPNRAEQQTNIQEGQP